MFFELLTSYNKELIDLLVTVFKINKINFIFFKRKVV